MSQATAEVPRIRCEEPKRRMAKAELPDVTIREKRAEYGQVLRRASEIAGLDRNQTAEKLRVDPAQVSRWWSGDENPQTWRYRQDERLRIAYLRAQAEVDGAVRVRTVIEVEER
jgi:ribosome-binding protein aMBF1 (putative translation factor)